jgi:purine nucleosidase
MATIPVVIDTDPGVDDAVALWHALTSPDFAVLGLTTVHGNVPVEIAAANATRIAAAASRPDVPVALGAAGAAGPTPVDGHPEWIHGADGLGGHASEWTMGAFAPEPASALLRRLVDERPGEVAVVTLGPLSNVAEVLAEDPSWAGRVQRLVMMGGSVAVGGNATPAAESNIAHDPAAAAAVVAAAWSSAPLLVGLDATHEAVLAAEDFALCAEHRTAAAAFCDGPLQFYRDAIGPPDGSCPCHDLLAVLALGNPELVHSSVLPVAVDTAGGAAWGATVVDRRTRIRQPAVGFSPWAVALGADRTRFRTAARALFGA